MRPYPCHTCPVQLVCIEQNVCWDWDSTAFGEKLNRITSNRIKSIQSNLYSFRLFSIHKSFLFLPFFSFSPSLSLPLCDFQIFYYSSPWAMSDAVLLPISSYWNVCCVRFGCVLAREKMHKNHGQAIAATAIVAAGYRYRLNIFWLSHRRSALGSHTNRNNWKCTKRQSNFSSRHHQNRLRIRLCATNIPFGMAVGAMELESVNRGCIKQRANKKPTEKKETENFHFYFGNSAMNFQWTNWQTTTAFDLRWLLLLLLPLNTSVVNCENSQSTVSLLFCFVSVCVCVWMLFYLLTKCVTMACHVSTENNFGSSSRQTGSIQRYRITLMLDEHGFGCYTFDFFRQQQLALSYHMLRTTRGTYTMYLSLHSNMSK